jgi:hypothetical protein
MIKNSVENMSPEELSDIYNIVSADMAELLNIARKAIEPTEITVINEDVLEKIRGHKRIHASCLDLNEFSKDKILERVCKKNMSISILAPICYEEYFKIKNNFAVLFMGKYLESAHILDENDRIDAIGTFVRQPWSVKIFEDNLEFFVKNVVFIICKYNLLDAFRRVGIDITIAILDEEKGRFCMHILFIANKKYKKYFSFKKIGPYLDDGAKQNIHKFYRELERSNESELNKYNERKEKTKNLFK